MNGPSPEVQRVLDALERGGFGPRQNGAGWQARCPGHEDRIPSLSISQGEKGRVLVNCHAGCEFVAILNALGLEPGRTETHRFDYRNADGQLLFRTVRRETPHGKTFHVERADGAKGLGGMKPVLYRLPEVLAAVRAGETVYILEGEKCVDALADLGLAATTNPFGAGKWREHYSEVLRDAKAVRILADNDEPGGKHVEQVALSLHAIGVHDIKVIEFAELPLHGDVADWLAAQHGLTAETRRAELLARVEAAAAWVPGAKLKVVEFPSSRAKTKQADAEPKSTATRGGARQGAPLGLEDAEPCADPVDGPVLCDELVATLNRWVVLPTGAAVAVALWIMLTYLTEVVEVLPRLAITSPTRSCGKSRLLALLSALARRALAAASITPSSLFRTIAAAAPTLLLDEMDNARLDDNPELRAVLNSGHTRSSAWTIRNVGEQHEPRRFSTWAPVALACIGKLPDTVASRSIRITMRRRAPNEHVDRLRESRIVAELEPLRRKLVRWAQDHADAVRDTDPTLPAGLPDREADNWGPLLAIAGVCGGEWPSRARAAAVALCGVELDETPGILLLGDLGSMFDELKADRFPSRAVAAALAGMENRPWPEWKTGKPIAERGVARLLKPFGIEPRTIRLPDGTTPKGYLREQFDDAFARYLAPEGATTPQTPSIAAQTAVSLPPQTGRVADRQSESNPHEQSLVADVADQEPLGGESETHDELEPCQRCGARVIRWEFGTVCSGCRRRVPEDDPLPAFMQDVLGGEV